MRFPKRALLDFILNLLFPVTCCVCPAQVQERRWGGACPDCWSSLIPLEPPFCPQCGDPAPAIEGLCGACRKGEHAFDFARSPLLFTRTLREIIHHLKYSDRVSLANPLGGILAFVLIQEKLAEMASRIYEPLDRLAVQLQNGVITADHIVQHGKVIRVKITAKEEAWTLQYLDSMLLW